MRIIRLAAIFGALAVILGAFGAHKLKELLSPEQLASFETGVRYQFYHTFALLICGILSLNQPSKKINLATYFFTVGIVFFSGSIYLLATRNLIGIENTSLLGPITPIGGLLFIIGWIMMFAGAAENRTK